MERILGGMIVLAAALMLWTAPAANAAPQIPPTPGCVATFKKLIKVNIAETSGPNVTPREEFVSNKKFADELTAAGCISSAEPLYREMSPTPFTAECRKAATAAQGFWGPRTRALIKLNVNFERKVLRPHKRRMKALNRRIKRLKNVDRPRQARALKRKSNRLRVAYRAKSSAMGKKMFPLLYGDAYDTVLIVTELLSLRCVEADKLFEFVQEEPPKGPVQKVTRRHGGLILASVLWVAFRDLEDDGDSSQATKSLPIFGAASGADRSALPEPLAAALAG